MVPDTGGERRPAGQLADKYERSFLAQLAKIAEIVVMGGAALGFYLEDIPLSMIVLFLMGAQSTARPSASN
jgi:acyl-[acyl-carrier-protein]-phospholipid O-acyltransferase/long-chain-fatty-acid--[acyl-carrier-protein] ligase